MLKTYRTITSSHEHEIEIKKSRFICTLARISSEEEARTIIQAIKKKHSKANHNCHAFVLGERQEIQRSSDDGEPSGTAGVPILEVLKQNELLNVLAVVTRYFGGTKLGAGGLIRAYSSATSEAIKSIGLVEGRLEQEVILTINYDQLNKVNYFLNKKNLLPTETEFSESVTLFLSTSQSTSLEEELVDLLHGQVKIKLGKTAYSEYSLLN